MWLLIFAGLLAISAGEKAAAPDATAKSESADDLIALEIDIKEPVKRSPITASSVYGASPSQYIIRHGDDAQELSPEYLGYLQQYTQTQPQAYGPSTAAPPSQRRLPAYAKQQANLQEAYQRQRVPAIPPPRPRLQYHSQAVPRLEAESQIQAQLDSRARADALHSAALGAGVPAYQSPNGYAEPKLGTFEQELLQLVSANQAQEFKLEPAKEQDYGRYSQQLVSFPAQYAKPAAEPAQLPEQYHIETSAPRYQAPAPAYQAIEEVPVQYQQEYAKPAKAYRPQYPFTAAQAQAEAEAEAQAQVRAQAQALAFQKVSQASHNKHRAEALEQIRIVNERFKQQSALEQIREGEQVSDAGRAHIEEQVHPKDPEAAYRARVKAQQAAELAEARRAQEAAEYKAHSDAILKLQAQQQAHLKVQEDAHRFALNFEKNQARAQAQAQAIANAQAEALYKAHQAARAKANNEAQAAAKAQQEARKLDPENTPVVQYLLPNTQPLPSPNSYFTNDQVQKYQASGSSYVPRSAPKPEATEQPSYSPAINQPRQSHKHKIPPAPHSSIYVSQSGLLKKSPVKSLTIDEIIEQDQLSSPQVVRLPSQKGQLLTQEDISALINAGYTVTPVPEAAKPTQQTHLENSSTGYYLKKSHREPVRPEYYADHQHRPARKNKPVQRQEEADGTASARVTYLVPLEPEYGTRQTPVKRNAEE